MRQHPKTKATPTQLTFVCINLFTLQDVMHLSQGSSIERGGGRGVGFQPGVCSSLSMNQSDSQSRNSAAQWVDAEIESLISHL